MAAAAPTSSWPRASCPRATARSQSTAPLRRGPASTSPRPRRARARVEAPHRPSWSAAVPTVARCVPPDGGDDDGRVGTGSAPEPSPRTRSDRPRASRRLDRRRRRQDDGGTLEPRAAPGPGRAPTRRRSPRPDLEEHETAMLGSAASPSRQPGRAGRHRARCRCTCRRRAGWPPRRGRARPPPSAVVSRGRAAAGR